MVSVAMGASSSSGLAVKGVNSAIRRVAFDQNKVRQIMQSKHAWTKVTKKNQWKYVKPIVLTHASLNFTTPFLAIHVPSIIFSL